MNIHVSSVAMAREQHMRPPAPSWCSEGGFIAVAAVIGGKWWIESQKIEKNNGDGYHWPLVMQIKTEVTTIRLPFFVQKFTYVLVAAPDRNAIWNNTYVSTFISNVSAVFSFAQKIKKLKKKEMQKNQGNFPLYRFLFLVKLLCLHYPQFNSPVNSSIRDIGVLCE